MARLQQIIVITSSSSIWRNATPFLIILSFLDFKNVDYIKNFRQLATMTPPRFTLPHHREFSARASSTASFSRQVNMEAGHHHNSYRLDVSSLPSDELHCHRHAIVSRVSSIVTYRQQSHQHLTLPACFANWCNAFRTDISSVTFERP